MTLLRSCVGDGDPRQKESLLPFGRAAATASNAALGRGPPEAVLLAQAAQQDDVLGRHLPGSQIVSRLRGLRTSATGVGT
jgi:hypothetical protein